MNLVSRIFPDFIVEIVLARQGVASNYNVGVHMAKFDPVWVLVSVSQC